MAPRSERIGARQTGTDELVGPYRLLHPLGEGGMGVVYRAEHLQSGEVVALKVVRLMHESMLASFRREIYALRSVEHPGVIRIVADGVSEGRPWYAMALLEGRTLGDYIDGLHGYDGGLGSWLSSDTETGSPGGGSMSPTSRQRAILPTINNAGVVVGEADAEPTMTRADPATAETMPPESLPAVPRLQDTLTLLADLCEPLAFVHGKGLVHRDLKPDNVLLRDDGPPVLVDFGLALLSGGERGRDVLDVAGRALGTPPYMAPEQIRGELVDARADLYALGCMLFECLTGVPPFVGGPVTVLHKHLRDQPSPPSSLATGIGPALDELVLRLLAKRPQDRYGFADDVARALRQLGARRPVSRELPIARPYLYRPGLAGRDALVEELEPVLNPDAQGGAAAGGHGACVLIGGQSGVGKTRLAMELANSAARRNMNVVTAQCIDVRASSTSSSSSSSSSSGGSPGPESVKAAPLHPFRPLLMAMVDRCRSEGIDETERVLGEHGSLLAAFEPSLAELPSQRHPTPVELPAEAAQVRLLDAFAAVLGRFTETQPLFLVLDDLQWADDLSLALLKHLDTPHMRTQSLVVVGTYRTEEQNDALRELIARDGILGVELDALGRGAVAAMVGDMLALDAPPASLIDFLMAESEGNPFFIAEYLRVAIGEQILQRGRSGVWALGSAAATASALREKLPLPGGLRELVRRRVDGLTGHTRALVELASVLGREVDGDVLFETASTPELLGASTAVGQSIAAKNGELRASVEELRLRQIVEEASGGGLRFAHDKLREIIYDDLPAPRRAALHGAAALSIERSSRGRADEALQYAILAHHFGAAGDRDKTIVYLGQAGEHALSTAASNDARRFFQRAIALADEDPDTVDGLQRAMWERRLGEACYNTGELVLARQHLLAALAGLSADRAGLAGLAARGPRWLSSALSSASALGGQLAGLALSRLSLGRLSLGRSQRVEASEQPRYREAALAAERLSQTYFFLNEPNLAFGAALQCADYAERLGSSPELARGYAVLSVGFGYVPMQGLVELYGRRAEKVASGSGDPHAEGFVAFLRGLATLSDGRHVEARQYLTKALDVARSNRDVRSSEEILAVLADAVRIFGDRVEAMRLHDEMLSAARRTHNLQGIAWGNIGRGLTLLAVGNAHEAIAVIDEARPIVEQIGDTTQLIGLGAVAFAHAMVGDWNEARSVAHHTLRLSRATRPAGYHLYAGYQGMCDVFLGSWERELSRGRAPAADVRAAEESCAIFDSYARIFRIGRPQALYYRGLFEWLSGRKRKARRKWNQALELAIELDMPVESARSHYEIGRRLPMGDDARSKHLTRAGELFECTSSAYWVERVRELTP
jgi:serine/threonine protein kinase/tetratricopeptide (TPR) repeat protein